MFNVESLVYFTSFQSQGARKWPKTPDEVLQYGCCLCAHIPADVLYFDNRINIPEDGYTECWSASTPAELCDVACIAVRKLQSMGVDTIYSVHPKSLLIPLVKWRTMRALDNDKHAGKTFVEDLTIRCVDLCESFHSPAILTFEQRSSFCPDTIGSWLALPSSSGEYTDEVLVELWRRLP